MTKWHILKYSNDPQSRALYRHRLDRDRAKHYGKGRRTSPCLQLESLEGAADIEKIIGSGQHGTRGLGYGKRNRPIRSVNRERRRQIGLIMRREAEAKRLVITRCKILG